MTGVVSPEVLIAVIGSLLACLGTVLWFFFQRLHKQIDKIIERLDGFKTFMHEVEVRMNNRIDAMDTEKERLGRDVSILFTRLEELRGDLRVLSQKVKT